MKTFTLNPEPKARRQQQIGSPRPFYKEIMKELLQMLLNMLDQIGLEHEEVYDSVSRNAMCETIYTEFLYPESHYEAATSFGLNDEDADERVKNAIYTYITGAKKQAEAIGLKTFTERLNAYQDVDIFSIPSGHPYDEFFGWLCPDDFNLDGSNK